MQPSAATTWLSALSVRLRAAVSGYRWCVGVATRHAPFPSAAVFAMGALAGAAAPLVVWAINGLIDALGTAAYTRTVPTAAARAAEFAGGAGVLPLAAPWLAVLFCAFTLRSANSVLTEYLGQVARGSVERALQRRFYETAVSLPLASFEQPAYYTKLENARRPLGGNYVLHAFQASGILLGRLIAVVGLLVLYARAHWLLAVVLLVTAVFRSIVTARQSQQFMRLNYHQSPQRRELTYWSGLLSGREHAAELRLFGLGEYFIGRWRHVFEGYRADLAAGRRRHALGALANNVAQEVVGLASVLLLLVLATRGSITAGALVALLYGLGRFRDTVNGLSWGLHTQVEHQSLLSHVREFLALMGKQSSPQLAPPPRPLRHGVRFRDVSFVYPGGARPALQGINLTLAPGERIALVGENGAGKSTLVRLLLGLYRPASGAITVDGVDLLEIDPFLWRREVTAVFQDFVRYPATAAENIAYGDTALLRPGTPEAGTVDDRIARAARRSAADGVIAALPLGYATLLGKEFEGGAELSGGEWQRLALARAYVRDAQIVVLDEPTAGLDPRAEVEVYRQFGDAAAGRCAVLISHRLGSARLADRIVVLRGGRIVEEGTHGTLTRAGGEYARLWHLQASWYAAEHTAAPVRAGAA